MEQNLSCYLMLIILCIGIHLKQLGNEFVETKRKISPCELLGICTLVYVNQDLTDERPFHFNRSGYIGYFYCG